MSADQRDDHAVGVSAGISGFDEASPTTLKFALRVVEQAFVEPEVGIEPTTYALRVRYTAFSC